MAAFPTPANTNGPYNPNNGYILPQPPDDSISRLRFSPPSTSATSPYIIASSWNGSARLWRLDSAQSATPMLETTFPKPLLDATWSHDGQSAFLSCVDKCVHQWDMNTNSTMIVAAHDAPVKQSIHNAQLGYLASISWDANLRYWDIRSPPTGKSIADVPLTDRAYSMDSVGVLMVVTLAQRKVVVFDIRKPTTPFRLRYSKLPHQSRCVACWPDAMGYVVGSVDGSVSVESVQENDANREGVFTCHHDRGGPFSINAVRFNPLTGALVTAASDGHVFFWDKDNKSRAKMKRFERMRAPVCDVDFFHDGSLYAYAVGYDWSKGAEGSAQFAPDSNYIVVQSIEKGEMTVGHGGHGGGYRGRGGRGRRRGHSRRGGG